MTEKKQTAKVGDTVDVKEGGVVRRPSGAEQKVTGGSYVLDEAGTFEVDGQEITVR